MRIFVLILSLLTMASLNTAEASGSFQHPPKRVVKGYVTEDGKRVGTCKNYRYRLHKHCKKRKSSSESKLAPAASSPENPSANTRIVRP